jgi:hypothetical protein
VHHVPVNGNDEDKGRVVFCCEWTRTGEPVMTIDEPPTLTPAAAATLADIIRAWIERQGALGGNQGEQDRRGQ